jgi:hypothetical protein
MTATYLTGADLACNGIEPIGPVCPWPKPEDWGNQAVKKSKLQVQHDTTVKASIAKMASGLFKTASYAISNGKVSAEIREERYNVCKECPYFIEDSKRCSECGCFMAAKTWVAAEPKLLCPKNKWKH